MRRGAHKHRQADERVRRKAAFRAHRRAELLRLRWTGTMCGTCAYRPGTEASREEGDPGLTDARLTLLAAYQPFYCHEVPPPGTASGPKACVGHMRLLARMGRMGYVPPPEALDRAAAALRVLMALRRMADDEAVDP